MDNHITKVVFRRFKEGDVIALFPEESHRHNYTTLSYQHVGQHSDCDYHTVISMTKLAKPEEYEALKVELESIGYNLDVKQKASITYK